MAVQYLADNLGAIGKRWGGLADDRGRVEEASKDKGCAVSPSCLACPLERCQFEVSVEERAQLLGQHPTAAPEQRAASDDSG